MGPKWRAGILDPRHSFGGWLISWSQGWPLSLLLHLTWMLVHNKGCKRARLVPIKVFSGGLSTVNLKGSELRYRLITL